MKPLPRIVSLFLTLCLVSFPGNVYAGNSGRITGKIKTRAGGALLGAVVTILKQDREGGTISFTRSDRTGSYSITNLTPGAYYMQVSREGYQPLTHSSVRIAAGKTTNLDVIMQEFLDFISADNDPRNWDLKTVVRSTSDRRLIFRLLPGSRERSAPILSAASAFGERGIEEPSLFRSAIVNVTSSAGLSSENYSVYPSNGRNGIVSNFALAEPIGDHGRMIFSGQLNSGYDSLWRVKNTYSYRPESGREMSLSMGYGRLGRNQPSMGSVARPTQFFVSDPILREGGIQTVSVEFESHNKISEPVSVDYGLEYSRVSHGTTKSAFSPSIRILITPLDTWTFTAALSSKRVSDNNSVILSDGQFINLMEPTYITQVDGEISVSQFKHAELAVGKSLADSTLLELAVFSDRMIGPGIPFLMTSRTRTSSKTNINQLREDQAAQRGMRVSMNRRVLDFLNGSIAYVYGSAASIQNEDETVTSDRLARDLLNYVQRSYYHSFTSQIEATVPQTKTHLTTIVRWYPGVKLNPVDLFYDRKDTLTKGVSFFIRQEIPLPEFMATAGRWEALVDVRNLFDQGKARIPTTDGELILSRNPRSVRFGLNLNLY